MVVTSMVVAGVHIVDHYYFCFEANKEQGTGANVLEEGRILLLEKFDVLKIDFFWSTNRRMDQGRGCCIGWMHGTVLH